MGSRDDRYELVVFVDASRQIYAAVSYLKNLDTNQISFLSGKNRLLNKQLEKNYSNFGITLGVEMAAELTAELVGPNCLYPLNIQKRTLYTDSSIAIYWLGSQAVKYDKMQKKSVFVMNRLDYVERICKKITHNL